MGVDVEHDYEPKYITIRGKGDILAALRKEAKKADKSISRNRSRPRGRGYFMASGSGT